MTFRKNISWYNILNPSEATYVGSTAQETNEYPKGCEVAILDQKFNLRDSRGATFGHLTAEFHVSRRKSTLV